MKAKAMTGVARWIGCHPTNRKVVSMIPGQGTSWVTPRSLVWWMFLSHISVSLLLFLSFCITWSRNPTPKISQIPRKTKTYIHIATCIQMFVESLFVIIKNWKKPKYQSTDEWDGWNAVEPSNEILSIEKNNCYIL